MESAFYTGTIAHRRYLPKNHGFSYPFFMFFLNLDELNKLPDLGFWFSPRSWALSRFHRPDYYGDSNETLSRSMKKRMYELTGVEVTGNVCGLLNMRTLGLYFSPVNFYYGFDASANFTHFLAEVSNTPWNERHQYSFYVGNGNVTPENKKTFKVSPFNPIEQNYSWKISPPGETLGVQLTVDDERGKIFTAALHLQRQPLTRASVRSHLLRKPVMTASIVSAIYWQAFKIFIKGIPYIPYQKESI